MKRLLSLVAVASLSTSIAQGAIEEAAPPRYAFVLLPPIALVVPPGISCDKFAQLVVARAINALNQEGLSVTTASATVLPSLTCVRESQTRIGG